MLFTVSTSKSSVIPVVLTGLLLLSGCGPHVRQTVLPAPRRGTADLDVLVRRHPAWRRVSIFDQTLVRLAQAGRAGASVPGDAGLLQLPPIETAAPPVPAGALQAAERRFHQVAAGQIARLQTRRAEGRRQQLEREREALDLVAQSRYDQAVQQAQAAYSLRVGELIGRSRMRRLNLKLEIAALQASVTDWRKSRPPSPELEQQIRQLADDQAALKKLEAERAELTIAAEVRRNEAVAQAAAARSGFTPARIVQREQALRLQDQNLVERQQRQLTAEQAALAGENALLAQRAPGPERLAAVALPLQGEPPAASLTRADLAAAEARVRAQRARWVTLVYDDTRAAALDAAQSQRWQVSFAKPRPGQPDLTGPLAALLAAKAWRG